MRVLLRVFSIPAGLTLLVLSEFDHIFFLGYPFLAMFLQIRFFSYLPDWSTETFFLVHFVVWLVLTIAVFLLWEDKGAHGVKDKFLETIQKLPWDHTVSVAPSFGTDESGSISLIEGECGALSLSKSRGALSEVESKK